MALCSDVAVFEKNFFLVLTYDNVTKNDKKYLNLQKISISLYLYIEKEGRMKGREKRE